VFSDTGNEMPETYEYIEKIMKPYLKSKNIEFITVYNFRKISLWTRCYKRKVIPDMIRRWCTRDFKVKPIHKFYKKLGSNIIQYIGIDNGESHRMKPSNEDFIENSYPLIDAKMNRENCIKYIESHNLPIPVKSGCFFCPYNNKERWEYIRINHPAQFKLSQELEMNSKHYPKQKLIRLNDKDVTTLCDGACMT
jgi:3'-phosphoadenosine 5'-phosphosulfate sulfotransferase (PAPS reductase)/FAD synthetase